MSIRWYHPKGKRFYVIDVLGYRVDPAANSYGGNRPPSCSYSVLDADNCHREIGSFYTGDFTQTTNKRLAEELAAKLNRQEERDQQTA